MNSVMADTGHSGIYFDVYIFYDFTSNVYVYLRVEHNRREPKVKLLTIFIATVKNVWAVLIFFVRVWSKFYRGI